MENFIIFGSHIGYSRWQPLHDHFIIYHDITYNQKHRFRHQFMIVCNLEGSLCGIFSLEVAILKMVS